jgi:hypothetical protein
LDLRHYPVLARISPGYSEPKGRFPRVTHPCATKAEAFVRLACVRHAASVRSEPESNSQVDVRQPPRGKTRSGSRASLGAVPAHHIYCGYVTRHVEPSARSRSFDAKSSWNGLNLPILQHPEVAGDRGRRPHVPSSKPTMSKSRRVFLPHLSGATGLPIEKTQTGLGKPCPKRPADRSERIGGRRRRLHPADHAARPLPKPSESFRKNAPLNGPRLHMPR